MFAGGGRVDDWSGAPPRGSPGATSQQLTSWEKVVIRALAPTVVVVLASVLVLALRPARRAEPRLLDAGRLRRAARALRTAVLGVAVSPGRWSHLLDLALLRTHRVPVATTPNREVWRDGPARLYRFDGMPAHREPVLIVHALATQPWILDLTPKRSLVRSLLGQGFDVFLLDWGSPSWSDRHRGLGDCARVVREAEAAVLRASGTARLHVVGYGTGGTATLLRAMAWEHGRVASLALIGPPVGRAPGGLGGVLGSTSLRPAMLLDGASRVPAALVRFGFARLRPHALRGVWRGWRRRRDADYRMGYGALARWMWEQRSVPGALVLDLVNLQRTDALLRGEITLADRRLQVADVGAPLLLAVAENDHLVPAASSLALAAAPGLDAQVLRCSGGHVSMVSGGEARRVLWPGLAWWLRRHQQGSGAPGWEEEPRTMAAAGG